MPLAEILSQGDEVVTGQITDTNAAWLAAHLTELGFTTIRHTVVGDRLPDLVALMQEIGHRADLCLCTGGLGPTEDDLTAPAMAEAFGAPLVFDAVAMAQIEAIYAKAGRVMPQVNRRQAMLPTGSTRIDNPWGTAPGFSLPTHRAWFVCLPGVPREMKKMFAAKVVPTLHERFSLAPSRLVTLRTVGVGESNLQEAIGSFEQEGVELSYRTRLPENHVKLRFGPEVSREAIQSTVSRVAASVRRWLFTVESEEPLELVGVDLIGGDHAEVIGRALLQRGHTLCSAESCTGGRVASACTAIPGASGWFFEGAVTYTNQAKIRQLGVAPATLQAHGAVSEPVARQMAEGLRERAGTTYAISTTGVAGPGGGTPGKPVGTVHIAVATPTGTHHRALRLPGDRELVQRLAAAAALELLRQHII